MDRTARPLREVLPGRHRSRPRDGGPPSALDPASAAARIRSHVVARVLNLGTLEAPPRRSSPPRKDQGLDGWVLCDRLGCRATDVTHTFPFGFRLMHRGTTHRRPRAIHVYLSCPGPSKQQLTVSGQRFAIAFNMPRNTSDQGLFARASEMTGNHTERMCIVFLAIISVGLSLSLALYCLFLLRHLS